MGHARQSNELLEVSCGELGTIVRDYPGSCIGKGFLGALKDGFNIGFLYRFPNLMVDDEAAVTIQDKAQIIKGAADV